ncbi:facilitated trehalose transporter Tret1-like isoform X2 [Leptopilina boulardi]|nr:facilitated trehalose transporter Tret1-like isoform X2 [Leptopilina boulardi]
MKSNLDIKRQSKGKGTFYQLQMCVLANLSVMGPSMGFGYSTVALPPLQSPNSEFKINDNQASWIASAAAISIPFGCFITSFVMRRGRKTSLLIISTVSLIGWLTIYLSTNVEQIIIGRILSGISTGLATVPTTVYAAEVSSAKWRSTVVTWTSIAIAAGVLIVYIFGFIFPENWRMVALLCAIFPLVSFIITAFIMPESPIWLRERGKLIEAELILKKFRGVPKESPLPPEIVAEFEVKHHHHKKKNLMKHILRRTALIPSFILLGYFFFQQFSGIFAVVYYAVQISEDSGVKIDHHLNAIFIGATRLIGAFLVAWASRRFGRRTLSILSGLGMTISIGCLSFYLFLHDRDYVTSDENILPVICLISYIFMSTLGFLVLPFAMVGELYPSKVKDVLSGFTTCIAYIFSFISVKAYPDMILIMGKHGIFCFYALFSLFGTIFVIFFLPETRGKTIKEIENIYAKKTISEKFDEINVKEKMVP